MCGKNNTQHSNFLLVPTCLALSKLQMFISDTILENFKH